MYELIDENNNMKLMALIICTFNYGDTPYCLYSIERDKEEDNLFISRIVKNSQGYTLDNNFKNGEKEALEDIVADFLSKVSPEQLKEQGFILNDITITGINKFNYKKCYITTYKKDLLKECMLHYNLEVPNNNIPLVKVKKSKTINKGNYEGIILIIIGIITIIVCLLAVIKMLAQ